MDSKIGKIVIYLLQRYFFFHLRVRPSKWHPFHRLLFSFSIMGEHLHTVPELNHKGNLDLLIFDCGAGEKKKEGPLVNPWNVINQVYCYLCLVK